MCCNAPHAADGRTAFRRSRRCAAPSRSAICAQSTAKRRHSKACTGGIFASRRTGGLGAAGRGGATSWARAWPTVLAVPDAEVCCRDGADVCCRGGAEVRFVARGGGGGGVERKPQARAMVGPAV